MDEQRKEEIRKQAREILDDFAETLANVKAKVSKAESPGQGMRSEKNGLSCDSDFRDRMFANAPKKNENCIIAEKAKW